MFLLKKARFSHLLISMLFTFVLDHLFICLFLCLIICFCFWFRSFALLPFTLFLQDIYWCCCCNASPHVVYWLSELYTNMGLFWLCTTLLLHLICVARLMPITTTITLPLLPYNHDFLWIILACCFPLSLLCFATLVAYYIIVPCEALVFVECFHKFFWIFCKNNMKKEEKETHVQVKDFFMVLWRDLLIFVTIVCFFVSSFFLWFSFFYRFSGMENFWGQFHKNFKEVGIRLGATLTMTKAYPNFSSVFKCPLFNKRC
jgi:hypothetical protein